VPGAGGAPRVEDCVWEPRGCRVEWVDNQRGWADDVSSRGAPWAHPIGVVIAAAYRTFRVDVKAPPDRSSPELSQLNSGTTGRLLPTPASLSCSPSQHLPLTSALPLTVPRSRGHPQFRGLRGTSSKPGRLGAGLGELGGTLDWRCTTETSCESAPAGRPSPELLDRVRGEMLEGFAAVLLGPGVELDRSRLSARCTSVGRGVPQRVSCLRSQVPDRWQPPSGRVWRLLHLLRVEKRYRECPCGFVMASNQLCSRGGCSGCEAHACFEYTVLYCIVVLPENDMCHISMK